MSLRMVKTSYNPSGPRAIITADCFECGARYEWSWSRDFLEANDRLQEMAVEHHNKVHEQFMKGAGQ